VRNAPSIEHLALVSPACSCYPASCPLPSRRQTLSLRGHMVPVRQGRGMNATDPLGWVPSRNNKDASSSETHRVLSTLPSSLPLVLATPPPAPFLPVVKLTARILRVTATARPLPTTRRKTAFETDGRGAITAWRVHGNDGPNPPSHRSSSQFQLVAVVAVYPPGCDSSSSVGLESGLMGPLLPATARPLPTTRRKTAFETDGRGAITAWRPPSFPSSNSLPESSES
jgi:hypothetical protein